MAASALGNNTKRRRGKKEPKVATTITTNPTAAPSATNGTNNSKNPLDEQLNRAQESIERSQAAVAILHGQWKSYLLRLSYFVVLFSIHQAQKPVLSCWRHVRDLNQHTAGSDGLSTWASVVLVVGDSLVYVLGLGMSVLVSLFLYSTTNSNSDDTSESATTFSNPWFLLANACIPAILSLLYVEAKYSSGSDLGDDTSGGGRSCLETAWFLEPLSLPDSFRRPEQNYDQDESSSAHRFPIVVVFHGIVTPCVWFMIQQRREQEKNLRQVVMLRKELHAKQQNEKQTKKKSK